MHSEALEGQKVSFKIFELADFRFAALGYFELQADHRLHLMEQ
jgi:hypothetical protein